MLSRREFVNPDPIPLAFYTDIGDLAREIQGGCMHRQIAIFFAMALTTTVVGQSRVGTRSTYEQLQKRAALLMPEKSQLRFQEIPWVHDLAEAQKIAQAENRPIFLWGYGGRARPDNGLEGC